MSQIAKMYLRGRLFTEKMKNLDDKQREEIEKIIEIVMNDTLLQQCRNEFCNALARTIKNEYDDRDIGLQDYRIAIMRAAVAAKHGKKPAEEALVNPTQRKKWFQTWAFNYLRQILRENKINCIKIAERVSLPADTAVLYHVTQVLLNTIKEERDVPHRRLLRSLFKKVEINETDNGYTIKFDHWSFPLSIFSEIRELNNKYFTSQVRIVFVVEGILVERIQQSVPEIRITKRTEQLVHETSFDADSEQEDRRDQLEMQIMNNNDAAITTVEEQDLMTHLKSKISMDTREVLEILYEDSRPVDYVERYGSNAPKIVHVAEYLGKSPKEIKRHMEVLRHNCMILGVGL